MLRANSVSQRAIRCTRCDRAFKSRWHQDLVSPLIGFVLLLLTALPLPASAQERLIVIGDSLSSTRTSWPTYVSGTQVMAQPGRTIASYDPPRDLYAFGGETIVYMLGTNDIGADSVYWDGDASRCVRRLQEQLRFLTGRGFKVLLVVPPDYHIEHLAESNRKHREGFLAISMPGVYIMDLDAVWDSGQTLDGLHPNTELSYAIALAIEAALAALPT